MVMASMRSQMFADATPRRSAKPGFMPEPKIELCPRSQASRILSRSAPNASPVMNAAVVTTLTPASRIATSSSKSGHFGL
jgi:hypothetical protein